MTIQLLLTGNELMSGDTVDSNSAMIAQKLAPIGMKIQRKVTVGDDYPLLVSELRKLCESSDVVIVNGGLGPTVDDLTAKALAEATEKPLAEHPEAIEHLQKWCIKRNLPLNDANLKQAILPEGAGLIDNPTGSAVGIMITHNNCLVLCTPGIPGELRRMMDETIVDLIAVKIPDTERTHITRLQTFGFGESSLQQWIKEKWPDWPESVELGFRAAFPLLEVKLTSRGQEKSAKHQQCEQNLSELMGQHVIGQGSTDIATKVVELLATNNNKITTAESCTGGLVASSLTEIAGASEVFEAGYVSYANKVKQAMLGVKQETLDAHGAVSKAVVREMALGALANSGADYVIAVSGIAGPDGGTADKPVGTVWLAWGSTKHLQTRELLFNTDRRIFQVLVTTTVLDLIRRELLGYHSEPRYFTQRSPWISNKPNKPD